MENFLKMEAIFSQNSPQNRTLETSIRHKNSEKGPTFSSKIPERVDIETLWWHTPVRKYHEFPPRGTIWFIRGFKTTNRITLRLRLQGIGYVQIRLGSDPLWYGSILFTRDRF